MLIEADCKTYSIHFPLNINPFISFAFIDLNKSKVERIVHLIDNGDKIFMGLTAGIKDGIIKSPFSAPFGGFHFKNNNIYISEIEFFLKSLQQFIINQHLKGIELVLPPNIYHEAFNAKVINTLLRVGFQESVPEITNWVNLNQITNEYTQKNSREYYRQALRNNLSFHNTDEFKDKKEIYSLINENRSKFDRPIYMTLNDILDTSKLWPIDFFKVVNYHNTLVASAIMYRCHPTICYATFWGDNENGRPLRAMDFLALQLWNYYKKLGYSYIDLGISTEQGNPNEGLLRFKESHDATSSLRYKFSWYTP
jgi:hypothetical protein